MRTQTSPSPATIAASSSICIFISLAYVLILYTLPRRVKNLRRDDPEHIKYRMIAVCFVTVILTIFCKLLSDQIDLPGDTFLTSIGLYLHRPFVNIIVTIVLMSIFYAGPLIVNASNFVGLSLNFMVKKEFPFVGMYRSIREQFLRQYSQEVRLIFLRNLIMAPITEEICFRALMIPFLLSAYCNHAISSQWHPIHVTLLAPIFFGLAHVHHFLEKLRNGVSVTTALLITTLQLSYTYIFGVIAGILFIRTGNITSPIVSHMICNYMGLPDLSFMSPPLQLQSVQKADTSHGGESGIIVDYLVYVEVFMYRCRYVYLLLHVGGLVAFSCLLFPLTETFAKESVMWNLS